MNTASPAERARIALPSWQRSAWPHALTALAVGAVAFAFRVLGMRGFPNDHYMQLAWSRQLLAGELPGRHFVDPGMPLTYSLSALAQAIVPGPYAETLLTAAMLGIAAALVCVIVRRLTGRLAIGVGAALLAVALQPRLYNYPKILVPMITLAVVSVYAAHPSRRRTIMLGAWTVVAALFRYDFGLYTGAAIAVTLLAVHYREPRRLAGLAGTYGLAVVLLGSPYAAFVQWSTGLGVHIEEAIEFARSDQHQLMMLWSDPPHLRNLNPATWGIEDTAVFLFYVSYGVVATALLLLAVRRRHQPPDRAPVVIAGAVLLVGYVLFVLRHPLPARTPDLASILAVMGAWSLFETGRMARDGLSRLRMPSLVVSSAVVTTAAIPLVPALFAVWTLSSVGDRIQAAALTKGWAGMSARAATVRRDGTEWPWESNWPSGRMPDVVRYLDECTSPSDRLLLTWAAPEYHYFARRQFAAGHALLLPPRAFTGALHQERMIARLEHQFVPIVLINETRHDEFVRSYGLLATYLSERYVAAGHYRIYDDSVITVAQRRDLRATGAYGPNNWPCHFEVDTTVVDPPRAAGR